MVKRVYSSDFKIIQMQKHKALIFDSCRQKEYLIPCLNHLSLEKLVNSWDIQEFF